MEKSDWGCTFGECTCKEDLLKKRLGDIPEHIQMKAAMESICYSDPAPSPLGTIADAVCTHLDKLAEDIFEANKAKGFWDEAIVENVPFEVAGGTIYADDFLPERRNTGELIALMHSELSEALEAHRKDKQDDHLPQYKGLHVELADALIRILDFAGAHDIRIGEIVKAKLAYNANRPHKHGKKY